MKKALIFDLFCVFCYVCDWVCLIKVTIAEYDEELTSNNNDNNNSEIDIEMIAIIAVSCVLVITGVLIFIFCLLTKRYQKTS